MMGSRMGESCDLLGEKGRCVILSKGLILGRVASGNMSARQEAGTKLAEVLGPSWLLEHFVIAANAELDSEHDL